MQKENKNIFSSEKELSVFEKCVESYSRDFSSVRLIETREEHDGQIIYRWALLEFVYEIDLYYIGLKVGKLDNMS